MIAGDGGLQAVLYPADREDFTRSDTHVDLLTVAVHDGRF
jgi:hypothetical protein